MLVKIVIKLQNKELTRTNMRTELLITFEPYLIFLTIYTLHSYTLNFKDIKLIGLQQYIIFANLIIQKRRIRNYE